MLQDSGFPNENNTFSEIHAKKQISTQKSVVGYLVSYEWCWINNFDHRIGIFCLDLSDMANTTSGKEEEKATVKRIMWN